MGAEKPMFNAYVNILSSPPSKHNAEGDNKAIFTPYQLSEEEAAGLYTGAAAANPDEAVSSTETGNEPRSMAKTAVDALETGYLAERNFYLDIVRREVEDCVDFAVKCDGGLLDEGQVRGFVEEMLREVRQFMEAGEMGEEEVV